MARFAQTEKDRNLASMIVGKYNSASWARKPREDEWWKARKRYEPSYVDETIVKRAPFVKVPYVYRVTNTQVSNLLQAAESNGRWVRARSTTPDHGAVGDVVTTALDNQFRWQGSALCDSNEDNIARWARGGTLYGNAALHVSWFEDEDDWGCRCSNIDLFDFFPDWRGGRWYVIRRKVSVAELGDIARSLSAPSGNVVDVDEMGEPIFDTQPGDEGRALKAFKKVLKEVKRGRRNFQDRGNSVNDDPLDKQVDLDKVADDQGIDDDRDDDPFNVRIEVIEYYETHRNGLIAKIVPGFGDGEDLVLQSQQNPYGICPIVPFTPNPIDNEFWGLGVSEITGPIAEAMDYNFRSQLRLVAKNADAPLLHRRNLRLRRDFLRQPTGQSVEVNDPMTDMAYLAPGHDQGLYAFALNFSKQIADLANGESEERRGVNSGGGTATQAAIAEAGGQTNDVLVFKQFNRSVVQVGRVFLAMLKKHVTTEKAIPMMGRDADALVQLKPEFLKGTFEVKFGGAPLGQSRQMEIAELFNYAQAFGASGVADLASIARMAARKMGYEPDDLTTQKTGRPKVSPKSENLGLFNFGIDVEVHPEDDDVAHITAHQKGWQELGQQDPVRGMQTQEAMQQHIQHHMMSLQAKQTGMGMGAPMEQGGQPAQQGQQMQQGQAGQPQTTNGRTQAVDQMRQQSNQAAGGGAPGGVAPQRQVGSVVQGGQGGQR